MKLGPVPRWTFALARSRDFRVVAPIVNSKSRGLSLYWNKPGSCSITEPIDSDVAMKAQELSTCIIAVARIYDDNGNEIARKLPWSGPIFNINDSCPEDTTQITALGWFQELESRFLDGQVTYTNVAGGAIALDLLAKANAKLDSLGRPQPTHIVAGTATDTQVRTRTYQRGQNIAAAIRELSEVENGYDFFVDPVTRELNFRPPTGFADRKKVKFGYRRPPFNMDAASRTSDAGKLRNRYLVQGSTGLAVQDDPTSMDRFELMMEEFLSISDAPNLDILNAYAGSELAFSNVPEQILTLKPKMATPDARSAPQILRDFELGDRVYASVDRGRFRLQDQPCRAFGVTLTFDQQGNQITDSFDINYSS